jgi:hypothetical protein
MSLLRVSTVMIRLQMSCGELWEQHIKATMKKGLWRRRQLFVPTPWREGYLACGVAVGVMDPLLTTLTSPSLNNSMNKAPNNSSSTVYRTNPSSVLQSDVGKGWRASATAMADPTNASSTLRCG